MYVQYCYICKADVGLAFKYSFVDGMFADMRTCKQSSINMKQVNTDCVAVSQGRGTLSRAPLQELYDPSMETSAANLDDLQRSWETLKNVVCRTIG